MTTDTPALIRLAEPGDLPGVRSCAEAAYRGYIPAIGRAPAPMVADFASQIDTGWVRVAEIDGDVAGYVVFFPRADHMFLESVAVHPDFAGRGLGRRLVAECEDAARRTGIDLVCLYTNAAMRANLSLYPHLGYRETGRRTEDGFDRVFFEKRL